MFQEDFEVSKLKDSIRQYEGMLNVYLNDVDEYVKKIYADKIGKESFDVELSEVLLSFKSIVDNQRSKIFDACREFLKYEK
jgi:hypothetical protein